MVSRRGKSTDARPVPAVGLVGIHGYGAVHLRELDRLAELGRARFVACADAVPPSRTDGEVLARSGAKFFADWRRMMDGAAGLDVVVIAAPPHLHTDICLAAVESGSHVLVEKPPVVSVESFETLLKAVNRGGLLCQVGFQSTGSGALGRFGEIVAKGEPGRPTTLVATGQWQRDRSYWARSEWAGKEALRGALVRDGALSNPFAHAVMNCLAVLGAGGADPVTAVDVERYRANSIEVEDTGCVRVTLRSGASFLVAVTLCCERVESPALHLHGPIGTASWNYEGDRVALAAEGRSSQEIFNRQSLLEQLLAAIGGQKDISGLSCPLERTRPFVEVLELVHSAPVSEIAGEHLRWEGQGKAAHAVIAGVDNAIWNARASGKLFSELAVPWAVSSEATAGP